MALENGAYHIFPYTLSGEHFVSAFLSLNRQVVGVLTG